MRFIDYGVRKKIGTVFTIITLAIIFQTSLTIYQNNNVRDAMLVFTDTAIPAIVLVKDTQNEIIAIRKEQYTLLSNTNHPQFVPWVQKLEDSTKQVETYLEEYKQGLWDDRDKVAYENVEKAWGDYKNKTQGFIPALKQHKLKQANSILLSSINSYQRLLSSLITLLDLNHTYNEEDKATIINTIHLTGLFNMIGVGILIVFMVIMCILLSKQICTPLDAVITLAKKIAAGDLTHKIQREKIGNDELGDLADACQQMQDKLSQLVEQISSASTQLGTSIEEISVVSEQASEGMLNQQDQINLIATAMNQMQSTVSDVAKNTEEASNSANSATSDATSGTSVVHQSINNIQETESAIQNAGELVEQLEKDSSDISMVVDVIRGIAEQTNLLALNAAIEAARAGEQGRGFAVVADEVRTLAGRTQSSIKEIVNIIEQLQYRSKQAVQATTSSCELIHSCVDQARQAEQTFSQIASFINEIATMNMQIASACSEQRAVSEEINRNIEHINLSSTEVAEGASQTSKAYAELNQLAENLQLVIRQFRII